MSDDSNKTDRIGYLCITMVILGFFLMLVKGNAFASCNKPDAPAICHDEFIPIDRDSHSCTPGAKAEVVSSPPAPKAGILCHCQAPAATSTEPAVIPPAAKQ